MIVAQLNLMGYSLSGYPALLKKYREHFFYWFWSDLVLGSYFLVGFIAAVGFAIRVAIERLAISRTLSRLENENLHSQLENLTRQINPHFLFNALNNIYYKIDSSNVAAREMVDHFASMLRYQLYDCNESQVPIEMELKLIENFVALQRSRLTPGITIECEGFDDIKGFTISPFLLLPVVENCFKHLAVPGPNTVEIDCKYENSNFIFHTSNSYDVNPLSKEISAGIGLSNIRKRLELTYNGNSKFTAEKKGDRFDTILQIEIDGYQMHNH
jgi:sensor histidine kinase YesM